MRDLSLYIIFTLIFLTASCAVAQPDSLWSARIIATGNPAIYRAMELSSGDFILVGETNPGFGTSNFLIARVTSSGTVVWTRTYGGPNSDAAYACVEMPDGTIMVAGLGNGGSAVVLLSISAAGDSLGSHTYVGGGSTGANDIALLRDGNIAVVGYHLGADGAHSDLWLLKCNAVGDTLWTRSYGGNGNDIGHRVIERQDRSLVIGGYSRSIAAVDYDMWLLRTDSLGNSLSSSFYGGTSPDYCYDLSDGDSVIYLAGKTTVANSNAGYLAKTSADGDSLWVRIFTNGGVEEQVHGIVARRSGGAVCAGWSGTSWNTRQCWLFAIHPDGSEDWHWILDPTGSSFYGIIPVSTGGYLAFGQVADLNVRKGYAVRISLSKLRGTVLELGTGSPVVGARVAVIGMSQSAITDQLGGFQFGIVNGTYDLTVTGNCISRDTLRGVVVPPDSVATVTAHVPAPRYVQLQSSINVVVHNHVLTSVPLQIANTGNGAMDFGIAPQPVRPSGHWLSVVPDTALIAAGDTLTVQVEITADTTDNGVYEFDGSLHVVSNACPGNSVTIPVTAYALDAGEHASAIPRGFALSAFPNPFNPRTTITFSIPQSVHIRLAVFDITGRAVAVLADGPFTAGVHQLPFDADLLPSGLYFARIESVLFTSTRKVMLIK